MVAIREIVSRGGAWASGMMGDQWAMDVHKVTHGFAVEALVTGWNTSGSGLSNPHEEIKVPSWLSTVRKRGIKGGKNLDIQVRSGEFDTSRMSSFEHYWYLLLENMKPNIDIYATAALSDFEKNRQMLMDLFIYGYLAFGNHDGDSLLYSSLPFFGRAPIINRFQRPSTPDSEVNIILLPKMGWQEEYISATTLREAQTTGLECGPCGWSTTKDVVRDNRKVIMRKQPTNSAWFAQVSRTVRALVNADMKPDRLDISSVLSAKPKRREMLNLEAVVTFAANLMVADHHSPLLTQDYINALGIEKYLHVNSISSTARFLRQTEISLYGGSRDSFSMEDLASRVAKYTLVPLHMLDVLEKDVRKIRCAGKYVQKTDMDQVRRKARSAYAQAALLMNRDDRFLVENVQTVEAAQRNLI